MVHNHIVMSFSSPIECSVCYDDCDAGYVCVGCGVFVCNSCRVRRVLGASTGRAPFPAGTTDASGLTLTCMSYPQCDEAMAIQEDLHEAKTLTQLRKICELQFETLCDHFRETLRTVTVRGNQRAWSYGLGDNVATHSLVSTLPRWVCESLYRACEDAVSSSVSPRTLVDLEASIVETQHPPLLRHIASRDWGGVSVDIDIELNAWVLRRHHLLALRKGKSILYYIIERAPIEILKSYVFLLGSRGLLADALNAPYSDDSIYPVHIASRFNGRAEILLREGANLHRVDARGRSVLMYAAAAGNDACVAYALGASDVMATDEFGLSALWYAISHGHPRALRMMLPSATNVNSTYVVKARRRTLLDIATLVQAHDCIDILIDFGADISHGTLHIAASRGHAKCFWALTRGFLGPRPSRAKRLFVKGLIVEGNSKTLLHIAAESNHHSIVAQIFDLLDYFQMSPSEVRNYVNQASASKGRTALHVASALGHAETVDVLVTHPLIDMTMLDASHRTAFQLAKSPSYVGSSGLNGLWCLT